MYFLLFLISIVYANSTIVIHNECSHLSGDVLDGCSIDCECDLCYKQHIINNWKFENYICKYNEESCPSEYHLLKSECKLNRLSVIVALLPVFVILVTAILFITLHDRMTYKRDIDEKV